MNGIFPGSSYIIPRVFFAIYSMGISMTFFVFKWKYSLFTSEVFLENIPNIIRNIINIIWNIINIVWNLINIIWNVINIILEKY